jgi:hypothetical protein
MQRYATFFNTFVNTKDGSCLSFRTARRYTTVHIQHSSQFPYHCHRPWCLSILPGHAHCTLKRSARYAAVTLGSILPTVLAVRDMTPVTSSFKQRGWSKDRNGYYVREGPCYLWGFYLANQKFDWSLARRLLLKWMLRQLDTCSCLLNKTYGKKIKTGR